MNSMRSLAVWTCGAIISIYGSAQAGQLGATRLIFNEGEKDASIDFINTTDRCVGLAVWTSDRSITDKARKLDPTAERTPIVLKQPPKSIVGPRATQSIRLSYEGEFPRAVEALYWFTAYEVTLPPDKCKVANRSLADADAEVEKALADRAQAAAHNNGAITAGLEIAVATHIKVLVRPKELKAKSSYAEASKRLSWVVSQQQGEAVLVASNPSNYHIHLAVVSFNGKELSSDNGVMGLTVTPQGHISFPLEGVPRAKSDKVVAKIVNDYGGKTEEQWTL
ncbi:molecular chaperone [Stenotrophomonas sp. B1-1]|uniref:fimbrial biogenesis chaperone n=1 Tax=Stenotrophomonas sp. B1-1 TaxID=2710648 RepID=UPI0013DA8EB2|nr:molecular chaperone [Stenotrophomonas sp. B1-1]